MKALRSDAWVIPIGVVLLFPALSIVSCSEDRCVDGDGASRSLLEDTPPYTPCNSDTIEFSPEKLVFDGTSNGGAPGEGKDEPGSGVPSADGGKSGDEPGSGVPSADGGEAEAGPSDVSSETGSSARVAVLVKSTEGAPRSRVAVDVYECGSSPLLTLEAIAGRGCERIGSRLRCTTDRLGSAEFTVSPSSSGRGKNTSICATSGPGKEAQKNQLSVTVERDALEDLRVSFAQESIQVRSRFALGCSNSDVCSASPRPVRLNPQLSKLSCDTEGDCLMPASRELRAWVSLARGANGDAWLSTASDCSGSKALGLDAVFPAGQVEPQPLYVCVDGNAATHQVIVQLTGGREQAPARMSLEADADPIVVDVESVTIEEQGAGGASSEPPEVTVAFRYETCGGAPLQAAPENTPLATLRLDSVSLKIATGQGETELGADALDYELRAPRVEGNPPLVLTASLSGNSLPGATECSWPAFTPAGEP
jgi:hypothetical protein